MIQTIKRVSKRSLSVLLCIVMIFSTMLVGMITTTAATVTSDSEIVIFIEMETSTDAQNWWNNDGCYHYAIVRGTDGTSDASVHLYNVTSGTSDSAQDDGTYYCTVPAGSYSRIDLYRGKTADTLTEYYNAAENISELSLDASKNIFGTVYNANFGNWQSWSTFILTSTVALSADKTTGVKVGESVNLTPEITAYSRYNDIKSNTYTVTLNGSTATAGTDYTISDNVFVPLKSGEFKINDNIVYNAKGYTNITKNSNANVTITVENSECKLTSSVIGKGSVTYSINGEEISDLTKITPDSQVTVNAAPAVGYSLASIKAGSEDITESKSFTISSDTTVEVTFTLNNPVVSLDADKEAIYVGDSATLTPTVTADLDYTGVYSVTKDGSVVNIDSYISDNVFSANQDSDCGTYVITYKATITDDGKTSEASDSVTITVSRTEDQIAYNTLVEWLADSSKNPANLTGKKPATLTAYASAYAAAQTAVDAGYPTDVESTTCQTALTALTDAYNALEDLTALAKPEFSVSATTVDLNSENPTLTLSVDNYSAYADANVTYTYYKNGEVLQANTTASTVTIENLTAGTYTFYVVVNVGDSENYYCPDNTSESKTVTAVEYFNITVESVSNATVKVVDTSSTEITQALYGDTVQVQVTVTDNSYKCTGVTVSGASDVTGSNGVYTFTMPAKNVTVKANVVEKTKYTVKATSNDASLGTVSPATSEVYEGSTVTLTASPIGTSKLKEWNIAGSYQISSGSLTSASITIIVNGDVTANAVFEEETGTVVSGRYLIYGTNDNPSSWNMYLPIYELSDGSWVARFTSDDFKTTQDYYFALSSSTSYKNMYWSKKQGDEDYENHYASVVTTDDKLISVSNKNYGITENNVYTKYVFGQFNAKDTVSSLTITCSTTAAYYIVAPYTNIPTDAIPVYAKDGTNVSGGTGEYGDTVLTSGYLEEPGEVKSDKYSTYYVDLEGGIITIQTTVNSTHYAGGYYVYAYVINGQTVLATSQGNGVYEATFSVPANSEYVEITPVYYNKNIEEDGNYITFYVDAHELNGLWGDIVACYSYYYKNGSNDSGGTYHGDGSYPGQPMLLNANGKYYTKLAKYYYNEKGENTGVQVSGLTLNSYTEKTLHATITGDSKNYQSYDYDDFVVLSDPALDYDTIQFDIEFREGKSNQSTLNNGNTGATKKDSITISTFSDAEHNGWTDFVNYDKKKTDILGNLVTDETLSPVYIVSTGNQNTSVGEWSTVWYVYDQDGKYISQGNPSDFIARSNTDDNTTSYNTMNVEAYLNHPTYICFESNMNASSSTSSNNSGTRCDGRWYYTNSKKNQAVVDTAVWYSDDNGSTWNVDETGTKGIATIDGVTEKTFEERNVDATLNAVPGNGYVFVEWGYVDDNGENYRTISKSASAPFLVDTNYHIVAKFEKIEASSLVLSHEKYAGSDAKGGFGFYYISAKHYDKNGVETSYANTEGNIIIPVTSEDKEIVITLTTIMAGVNTFVDWYEFANGEYQIIGPDDVDNFGKTGTVSYTFTVSVADLYDGVNDLLVQTLNFYSDIAPVTADAVLNYKYYNRFNEERTYTVKTTLTDEYIAQNGLTITEDLIYKNSPAVDDLYKDCKWVITDQQLTLTGTTATLWAVQTKKQFNVSIDDQVNPGYNATVYLNDYIVLNSADELIGVTVKTDSYNFVNAPEANDDNQPFSYWLVEENGVEVARCYSRVFNLKIAGDYTITAIYGMTGDSLTITDAIYSREQFTNDDGTVTTDYLYADFIVAYMPSDGILLNGVYGTEYTTGIIIEYDRYIKVDVEDQAGNTLTEDQKIKYADDQLLSADTIKEFAVSGNKNQQYDTDNDGTKNRALINYTIDNSKYNNKNRLDYYIRYKNTAANRQYVFRAYYYVITPDGEVLVTDAVYYYLYDIGNSVVD